MLKCFINDCSQLLDPLTNPDIMDGLGAGRREKILRLKHAFDRKRSLMAGIMIRDNLTAYGVNPDNISTNNTGRPFISGGSDRNEVPGIDFNISHSGDYVIMGISDVKRQDGSIARIGCDIEQIRDRNTKIAERYFDETELVWIEQADDKTRAFYQIWTARESYIKMTGEGILLDFKKYRVEMSDTPLGGAGANIQQHAGIQLVSDTTLATPIGVSEAYRDNRKQACTINQWLLDDDYIISICTEKDDD